MIPLLPHEIIPEVRYEKYTPIQGDVVFTFKEFVDASKSGSITDDDGSGWYGNERLVTNIPARPSQARRGVVVLHCSHVHWYNK